jgi:hypothetical protein
VSSSSSTEAPPDGPAVGGFEIESVLGKGPRGTVFVATQTGLRRRVALKLYAPSEGRERHDFSGWPEHSGVARLHVVGSAEGRAFTASQLAAGGSLGARLAAGDIAREQALALCDQAAATLAAVGVAHGALGAGNILIDASGRALLSDFGMAGADASAAADERALERLRARCERLPSGARRRRRPWRVAAPGVLVGAVAAAALAGPSATGDRRAGDAPPALLPGTTVLGSTLTGGTARTYGCDGRSPNGSAPRCTIVAVGRDGRAIAFPAAGVIRRWAVRGARGQVLLQVARRVAPGRYITVGSAQARSVAAGAHAFTTDLAVRRGDLLAIELRPGAGVGIVRRAAGATTARVIGALRYARPRPAVPSTGTALDGELQVRVEYVAGGRARRAPSLTGPAAREAPPGRRLAAGDYEFGGLRVRTFALVALPGEVALDLLRGATRLQRVTVVGADPRGTLAAFVRESSAAPGPYVVWRNPDGREIVRHYRATADALTPID